jgi:hypothetical protein
MQQMTAHQRLSRATRPALATPAFPPPLWGREEIVARSPRKRDVIDACGETEIRASDNQSVSQ